MLFRKNLKLVSHSRPVVPGRHLQTAMYLEGIE